MISRMLKANLGKWTLGVTALLLAAPFAGCSRKLTIYRDEVINTNFDRNGVPMDVDIVSVYPSDFKDELEDINRDLLPGQRITSDMWFLNRPTRESAKNPDDRSHYRIPRERILSFCERAEDTAGERQGGRIRGSKYSKSGEHEIVLSNIPVGSPNHERSVIFVFCRFTDANGTVLQTRPAEFRKPARFGNELGVRIRADSVERLTKADYDKDLDEPGQPR
ncbi:MAG TPA: hypothetical protein VNT79_10270 [Phycisphaerae bacterium]|nr:hypothetical protein [Phycisphaerae bacterium]